MAIATISKAAPALFSDEEWQVRVDLAACYRAVALYGLTDLIYNHITARVPGTHDQFLINPFGLLYEEITASSLYRIDLDGNILWKPDDLPYEINHAGYVIHSAVHGARHDVGCVIHTHSRAGIAVSAMDCGLLPISQTALILHASLSYHEFEGPALDEDERERLVADLGDTNSMILRNHGLLVCGSTVAEAFVRLHHLENACAAQVDTMAAGAAVHMPSQDSMDKTAEAVRRSMRPGANDPVSALPWQAILRKLDRIDPSYRN